jgi:hypothetical protein
MSSAQGNKNKRFFLVNQLVYLCTTVTKTHSHPEILDRIHKNSINTQSIIKGFEIKNRGTFILMKEIQYSVKILN